MGYQVQVQVWRFFFCRLKFPFRRPHNARDLHVQETDSRGGNAWRTWRWLVSKSKAPMHMAHDRRPRGHPLRTTTDRASERVNGFLIAVGGFQAPFHISSFFVDPGPPHLPIVALIMGLTKCDKCIPPNWECRTLAQGRCIKANVKARIKKNWELRSVELWECVSLLSWQ